MMDHISCAAPDCTAPALLRFKHVALCSLHMQRVLARLDTLQIPAASFDGDVFELLESPVRADVELMPETSPDPRYHTGQVCDQPWDALQRHRDEGLPGGSIP